MGSRLSLAVLVLAVLGGCGGGGGDDKTSDATTPTTPAREDAVSHWADAAQVYWQEFGDCGARAYPARGFFASCTKESRREFHETGTRAVRARASGACAAERARLKSLVAHVRSRLDAAVKALDDRNDAALAHRPYRGPPLESSYQSATQALDEDVPAARELGRKIAAGC
jgi:hypothetical protein